MARAGDDTSTPDAASTPPLDPYDVQRARRRDPAERRMSRASGGLLLLIIVQAAFGYALVGLSGAAWVRDVHFGLGVIALGLAALSGAAARMLTIRDGRAKALTTMGRILLALMAIQLVVGLMLRGWIPSRSDGLAMWHIGNGLLVTLLITVMHVIAIGPSLLLGARREQERARERMGDKTP